MGFFHRLIARWKAARDLRRLRRHPCLGPLEFELNDIAYRDLWVDEGM